MAVAGWEEAKPQQTVLPAFQADVGAWQPRIAEHGLKPPLDALNGQQLHKLTLQALFWGVAEISYPCGAGQGERLAACIVPISC